MPSPPSRWFHHGTDPGTIITLDQPVPSRWKILEKLNEHDFQVSEEMSKHYGSHSLATTKLLCCDPTNPTKKAFIRVYLQVPYLNTEMKDPKTRALQATKYTPRELTAYQEFTRNGFRNAPKLLGFKISTQDKSGLVPKGFAIWLAWEVVPGLRLGDKHGDDPFWTLMPVEREKVRMAFLKTLPTVLEKGYSPDAPSLSNLVWHKQTETLYFIGYFYGIDDGPKRRSNIEVGPEWLAHYKLAKPSSDKWLKKDWDGNTTGWEM
ncbi:uncharacterized protein CDV56_108752 [Aspergillus thermomutatus]|uniref:Uncharacterized protein n=1 Tax=Aspergillus thermomutatus TaxID=41047 RepID=A0A397HS47_ASPTH|nr:uncharacterized protein CDV56_108752 [Aspergillus thermomutatus]RHZ65842.1 hypothetical protein CDV56_108752 [Aspergillus thermomutatus]